MTEIRFEFPYASKRMPVMGRNVVATSQPLAAQAGLKMLGRGGNAVDAAIAAAVTLTVVEPTGNGIGSDAFAIVWDNVRLHGLNASGRSPAAWTLERFDHVDTMPLYGWDAVTVPGAVSAWSTLSKRFGRLPFEDLFEPAITYARDGFQVTPHVASVWRGAAKTLAASSEFGAAFLPNGRAPEPGERFSHPEQATTLERIAATLGDAFYKGDLADAMVAHAARNGGLLSHGDLGTHAPDWVATISQECVDDIRLHELPPNGQGLASLIALGLLQHQGLDQLGPDSVEAIHLQIEAMKLAFADTYHYVADPSHMGTPAESLLDPEYLRARARAIDRRRAQDPRAGVPTEGGTVYVTTADEDGNMVSLIQSNFHGFGSGVVVPGTGISLQNRGAGFSLDPHHPNVVAGGKRPFHTIIPAFLTQGGSALMGLGVMGGPMQPQGHLQLALRTAMWHQNPQAAIDAPRWRWMGGRTVAVEPGIPSNTRQALEGLGHEIVRDQPDLEFAFGGAQAIYRSDDGYIAGSDPRKDGQAVAF